MKTSPSFLRPRGFTLMETVIAIGVLSVLLTGFLIVFIPAADGIKKSISIQEADRLVAVLEQELVSSRPGETPSNADAATGFEKALWRIRDSTGPITSNLDTIHQIG
jgi:prepilin-type N-terminal cleavage/methylation domain-containing protein